MQHFTRLIIIALLLLLCACQRTDKQTEALLDCADSLLIVSPDSALALLQSLPTSTKQLAKPACAHYALLLARATDKCMKPLLPCDSLLDVALDYYGQNHPERATALLYKGRLEVEMAQSERAVDFFLEGLHLTEQFPEEIETKRHLLSSLGHEYLNARLYEKAGKTFRELQKYCFTDKDKAIALNRLGAYYSMVDEIDSTLIYQL